MNDGCQTAEENSESFKIFENGASFEVRFSISTFAFRQSETKSIFLHCMVNLKIREFFHFLRCRWSCAMKFVKSNAQTNTAGPYRYKIKLTSKGKRSKYCETAPNQSRVTGPDRVHPNFNPFNPQNCAHIFRNL